MFMTIYAMLYIQCSYNINANGKHGKNQKIKTCNTKGNLLYR